MAKGKNSQSLLVEAAPLFEAAAQEAAAGGKPSRPLQPTEYQPKEGWKPDEDEIATELVKELRDKLAYFHSDWKMYQHGVWQSQSPVAIRRHLRVELRDWRKRGIGVSQNKIKSLAAMLEDDLYIDDRDLIEVQQQQKQYINLRNGMFNLDTMEFEPQHKPELYFTTQLDFDYDEEAICPNFKRYLNSSLVLPGTTKTDGSLITLVLEALAYSMTARTDMKASFWLVGAKDSGKSTFITLLKTIMGSLHGTLDLTQLGTNRFLLAGLVGKRVVTFTEATENTVLPDALYKTITGGSDEIYADVKNREPITFRPEAKIWWAMNGMPRITDRSGATTRRIYIIPFNRTIPENERQYNLESLLMKERAGIFNEMVNHYKRLTRAGHFEPCEQAEQRRQDYIMENDTEQTYLLERCEQHPSFKVQSKTLYDDYKQWCFDNGFHSKNHINIANEWRRLGLTDKKSDGVTIWHGAKLREQRILQI